MYIIKCLLEVYENKNCSQVLVFDLFKYFSQSKNMACSRFTLSESFLFFPSGLSLFSIILFRVLATCEVIAIPL